MYLYQITQCKPWFILMPRTIYNLFFWKTWALILLELCFWECCESFPWILIVSFTNYVQSYLTIFFKKTQLRLKKAQLICQHKLSFVYFSSWSVYRFVFSCKRLVFKDMKRSQLLTLPCLDYKKLTSILLTSLLKLKFEHVWSFENCFI